MIPPSKDAFPSPRTVPTNQRGESEPSPPDWAFDVATTLHYTRKTLRKIIMQEEETFALRALKTSTWVTVFTTLWLFATAHSAWAWGFLIGALLSLFSLFSLTVLVPMLFRPGAPRHIQGLLSLTLFMKLPLYLGGLYLATSVHSIAPMGAGLGVTLVPMVITLKAIGGLIMELKPATRRAKAVEAAPATAATESLIHSQRPARATRLRRAEPVRERG